MTDDSDCELTSATSVLRPVKWKASENVSGSATTGETEIGSFYLASPFLVSLSRCLHRSSFVYSAWFVSCFIEWGEGVVISLLAQSVFSFPSIV